VLGIGTDNVVTVRTDQRYFLPYTSSLSLSLSFFDSISGRIAALGALVPDAVHSHRCFVVCLPVCLCVPVLDTLVSRGKTTEPIDVPLRAWWTRIAQGTAFNR